MTRRLLQIALGVVLGLGLTLVVLRTRAPDAPPGAEEDATARALLAEPFPAPALDLVDPAGRPVHLDEFRGSVVALFFGYTYCPDVCPLTLAVLGRLQEEGFEEGPPVEVLFVSVDPERDGPARLERFTAGLPGSVHAATGEGPRIREQAVAYGVDVRRPGAPDRVDPEGPVPDYRVDHTARTFLIDPRGRVSATLPPMVSAPDARAIIEAVRSRGP